MTSQLKNSVRFVYVFIILMLLVTACGPKNSLIGKWEDSEGMDLTFEFLKDGRLITSSGGMSVEGTYENVDKDTISVTVSEMFGSPEPVLIDFSVTGDTLILTAEGESVTFYRVNE